MRASRVARAGTLRPKQLPRLMGFGVSVPLLEQAFRETYGLDLKSVLSDEDSFAGGGRRCG
jgi:hypothetical protein